MSFFPLSVRPPSPPVTRAGPDPEPGDSPPASPGGAPGGRHALGGLPPRLPDGGAAHFATPGPVAAAPPPPLPLLTSRLVGLLTLMRQDLTRVLTGAMGLLPAPADPGEDGEDGGAYDDFLEKTAALAYILDEPLLHDLAPEERLMLLADAADADPVALFDMPRGMFEVLVWETTRRISNVVREQCINARAPSEHGERVIAHLEAHARACIGRLGAMGTFA